MGAQNLSGQLLQHSAVNRIHKILFSQSCNPGTPFQTIQPDPESAAYTAVKKSDWAKKKYIQYISAIHTHVPTFWLFTDSATKLKCFLIPPEIQ